MVLGGASGGRDYWSLLEVEVGQDSGEEDEDWERKPGRLCGGTVERKPWRRRSHLVGRDSEAGAKIIGLLLLG
jgi:hypothetical protein